MNKNKMFSKKFVLVLSIVGVLIGVVMLTGFVKGNPTSADNSNSGEEKPVIVNIQVDLEKEGDQVTVYNILNEIEKHGGYATIFVTGEFASLHPDIVKNIEAKEHQIAVHGWQKGEDLTLLSYEEQLALIQKSFSAVRMAVTAPEEVVDFKPQGYKFNDETIRVLQDFGAKSISGIFKSNDHQSFSACWYVQSLGEVTFPYPITNEFWAIPISTIEVDSEKVPLDDEYFANSQDFPNYLLEKYNQQTEPKDPLIVVVHSNMTGADEVKLKALSQFLEYVKNNRGKIAPLSSITHFTDYITNFDAIGPSSAYEKEEVMINVNYTSNVWCPYYRFKIYGKYPEEKAWKEFKNKSYCEFVYTGGHTFSRSISIPELPKNKTASTYTVRVVGRASYGGCPAWWEFWKSELWPSAESYDVVKDIQIEVTKKPLCVPHIINGDQEWKKDVVFVPDEDYWEKYGEDALNKFKEDIDHKINARLGGVSPIKENMDKFNFYYTEQRGNARQKTLPANFWKDESCKFADAVIILHARVFGDSCNPETKICSAEGPTRSLPEDRSFIHESGHGIFGLRDEYDALRYDPYTCDPKKGATTYNSTRPLPSNIWESEEACRNDAINQENPNECYQFTACQDDWWKLGDPSIEDLNERYLDPNYKYIMYDGQYFYNGFGKASERAINDRFSQLSKAIDILYPCDWCPKYAEKLVKNSVSLYLNINNNQLTLLESEFSESPSPNYYSGDYPFKAEIISLTGEILGEYGFGDPRVILAEIGYIGPTWIDNVDFPLILPYFHNAKDVNIYSTASESKLLLSVDISQYTTGIIEGKIIDYNGNPVADALVEIEEGLTIDSTFTDENGNYLLVGLQPGNYLIIVRPNPYANLQLNGTSISLPAGEIVARDFVLNPVGSIAGTVTDINGNPIANVHLYLSGYETARYATNEEGKYIIPGLEAGTYTINIDAPGYGPWYIFVNDNYVKRGASVTVNVTLGQTTWVDFSQKSPPMPDIWVEPTSFELTLPKGKVENKILTIGNNGDALLEFEITDQFGTLIADPGEGGLADIKQVFASVDSANVNFLVETYTNLPDSLWGIIWLDTDQDPSTGVTEEWWPDYGLNDIGTDYALSISIWGEYSQAYLYRWTGNYFEFVSYLPISLNEDYFAVSLPLSAIADDGNLDFTLMMGWDEIVPDEGYGTIAIEAIDWLSASPIMGTVEPDGQVEITIAIDATNLEIGEYKGYIVINSNDLDEDMIYLPVNLTVIIPATIDCDPNTLNLNSKGQWITCYIELPAGYDVWQIDGSTVLLNGEVPAYLGKQGWAKSESNESNIIDDDGELKRMVKFERDEVQDILEPGEAILTITGEIGLADFEGQDTITVTIKSPRTITQETLSELEAAKTGDSSIDAEIDLIIQSIERSLTDNYWLDSSHLDSNYGRRVFSYQKRAVERMEKDLLRQDISEELKKVFRRVIKKLAKAAEILAVITLEETKDTPIQNPRYQRLVQRYLSLAEEELAKAYQQLAQDKPEEAIDSFRRSWDYSQRAINYANR